MDFIITHSTFAAIVDEKGWDGFLEHIQKMFPNKDIYSVTQDWYYNKKFICKAKGTNGDIIIGWI